MKFLYCLLALVFVNIYGANQDSKPPKVSFVKEVGRVLWAMPYTRELYHNVRLIYNDPSITRFGSYQPLDNDGIIKAKEDARATKWYPSITKKTEGSPVLIDGKPIYYKMYMPEGIPLKAVIFDIYGGSVARYDAIFGWYFNTRVLASQGYGVVILSLSDVQDKSFPDSQTAFETKHFAQLINEIKKFLTESFASIKVNGYEDLLHHAQTVPHFLMGGSFGGLLTLKCATDPNFLSATNGFLNGFIAQAPSTYQLVSKTNRKLQYDSPIGILDDLPAISNFQLAPDYSPILDVANLQKPVLLMHSHYDMRVPLDHSLRFYEAARRAGKDGLVSLWVDEQKSRHSGVTPSSGTFEQAKKLVDREEAIIEKFIEFRRLVYSSRTYERWVHAYPKSNNSDIVGSGLSPIRNDESNEFYRTAIKELVVTPSNQRNIERYVNSKLASKQMDYMLMYGFLMEKAENSIEEDIKTPWDSKYFNQKLCSNFPALGEVSQNIESYLSNTPFITNLPSLLGEHLAARRQMRDRTKECSAEVAHALIDTYTEYFYTFFGKNNPAELRQELERLTREKMLAEAPAIVANLKKIFAPVTTSTAVSLSSASASASATSLSATSAVSLSKDEEK